MPSLPLPPVILRAAQAQPSKRRACCFALIHKANFVILSEAKDLLFIINTSCHPERTGAPDGPGFGLAGWIAKDLLLTEIPPVILGAPGWIANDLLSTLPGTALCDARHRQNVLPDPKMDLAR